MNLISEYGRWDDALVLLDTPVEKSMIGMIAEQLSADSKSDKPSLLAKWLPSENGSFDKKYGFVNIFTKELGITPKEYRKSLSKIREKLEVTERLMCQKRKEEIKNVSSKCKRKNKKYFK